MDPAEVRVWRKAERQRLLALRTGTGQAERGLWEQRIEERLRALLQERPGIILGVYWPFQAEFDPRPLIDCLIAEGSAVALPAVIDKKGPLEYRAWRPGERLVDGSPQDRARLRQAASDLMRVAARTTMVLDRLSALSERTAGSFTPRPHDDRPA